MRRRSFSRRSTGSSRSSLLLPAASKYIADVQQGQGQHDQEAGGGARPAEDRADGGVPIVIVVVILLFFRCCFHRCSHCCQYHLVCVGDPTAGEHREGK